MKKVILILLITSIFSFILNAADANVRLNSVGFIPTGAKGVTTNQLSTSYEIRQAVGGAVVSTGNFGGAITAADSGETVYKADFSAFTTPGTFYLRALNGAATVGNSVNFTIAEDVYNAPYITAMRAMYLWRCNTAVSGVYNGDTFAYAACHMNDAYLNYVGGPNGTIRNGHGGWHDAGDYNKYIVNAGITVGMMFMAWEHYGATLSNLVLSIPDTAPGYPEYLKELKYEIDWVRKMDYADGSGRVSAKLSATGFNNFELPHLDTDMRYFTDWGSAATADYVAMLAMAGRIFRPYDPAYAAACIAEAWISYNYLVANPANKNPDFTAFSTGGYGTTDGDDRLWAAAEMWATTGDATVHNDFITRANGYADKTDEDFDWSNVKNLGMYTYLMCTRTGKNAAIFSDIQADLVADANAAVTKRNNHGYGRNLGTNYYWGCNGSIARQAMLLQLANIVSPNVNYTNTALDAIGYLFGRNMHRASYVTGIGSNPAMFPHDRRSGGDTVTNPWPGYLVGGSSGSRGDDWQLANMVAGLPPAQYWTDVEGSYSSNEIAINWQGALIYALASFAKNPATPTVTPTASRTATSTPYAGSPTFTSTATPIPTVGVVQPECVQGSTFVIDGNLNEPSWSSGTWTSVTRLVQGAAPVPVTARYKVKWDNTYLIVGVEITDPALYNDSVNYYDDDSIEVYIDANNNKSATYAADDYQYALGYNDAAITVNPAASHPTTLATADTAVIAGGYSAEFRIPWSELGRTAAAGLAIGFDVGVNYDQNGLTREGVLMWNGTANNWTDTSVFGDAILSACGTTPTFTPTRTRTSTPVNTLTFTPTITRTNTPVNTLTYTATNSQTFTRTITLTFTQTVIPTDTFTSLPTSTYTMTRTSTPVNTSTFTRTNTPTRTQTVLQSPTDSPTVTLTLTGTPPTSTATETITQTHTETPEDTVTMTYTNTPVDTVTFTHTNTPVDTVTLTHTATPVDTATLTWTSSPVNTFTRTATNTHTTVIFSPTFTRTFTPTFTRTQTLLPTATRTHTRTATLVDTQVATATITQTPVIIPPVNTPVFTQTPVPAIVWPCPLNPQTQDLFVGYDVTAGASSVKFKVYTKAFRLIKSVEILGTMPASLNTGKVDRQYLQGLSNGLYYYVIESTVSGGTVRSKIKQLIILR